MIKSNVKSDFSGLQSLINKFKRLDDWYGVAGFDDSIHPVHGLPLNEIMEVNEYGDGESIPSRPAMRTAAEQSVNDIGYTLASKYNDWINGKINITTLFKNLSEVEARWISYIITTNSFTPNSQMTIKLKGSSQPLVDSGYMAQNVMHKAEKG